MFTIKHGINADEGDPNYDLKQLALECSTKRMYPDVVFYDNIVKITGSFKAPMGCRSYPVLAVEDSSRLIQADVTERHGGALVAEQLVHIVVRVETAERAIAEQRRRVDRRGLLAAHDAELQRLVRGLHAYRVSNGQTPFVTVGFGLGTSWFAREIQRAILLNRIRGLGKDRHTAIFPKLVFTIKHGINADEGDSIVCIAS